jgi:hypothetical protein
MENEFIEAFRCSSTDANLRFVQNPKPYFSGIGATDETLGIWVKNDEEVEWRWHGNIVTGYTIRKTVWI